MDTAQKDFLAWLHRHAEHFKTYTPDEIAAVALACGFPMEAICGGVTTHGTMVSRLQKLWESPFFSHWTQLWLYEDGHTWEVK